MVDQSNMPDLTPEMVTAENAAEIAVRMARTLGPGFHPEDDLHEFVWVNTGEPVLSPEDADRLNRVIDAVYVHVDACAAIIEAETPGWRIHPEYRHHVEPDGRA